MEAMATILIRRDQEEVFRFVSDPLNMDKWVGGLSEMRITSEGEVGKGSTFLGRYNYSGRASEINFEVILFDPPRGFGTRSTEGPFPFRGMVTLQSHSNGTVVTNTIDAGADSTWTKVMFALFGPLLRRGMRKQLREELEVLKSVLEHE
jgi:uncharacterized protein YndB with AHSA1/START domain